MTRLFVAAWPDAETIERLRALGRPDEPDVRWVPERNLHVTLRFLGDVESARTFLRPGLAVLSPSIRRPTT